MKIQSRNHSQQPQQLDSDPIVDRIMRGRGINSASEYDYALDHLLPYHQLKGIDAASDWLLSALDSKASVCIVGDYDVDGATSTSIMVRALRTIGMQVNYMIPNRVHDGYGLSPALVEKVHQTGATHIITVDNGIVSFEGVDRANALGMTVLITDHHMATDRVPDCIAVNPNQPECEFPSKCLAGVGVAYYVLIAFRAKLREHDRPEASINLLSLIDIVALGTVADCVPLDRNNRLIIAQGIQRIQKGVMCEGIKALLKISKRNYTLLEADDLGFSVGPRLNAAGRLEEMTTGVACLLADDNDSAMHYATVLDDINKKRRDIQSTMLNEAKKMLEKVNIDADKIAIVYHPKWHEGVIGLVASMLKEAHHIPSVALAADASGELLKGSCRSIPGLNIRDVLVEFDRLYPNVLVKFGGHAMAAGLSLYEAKLPQFKKGMLEVVSTMLTTSMLQKTIMVDGPLPSTHRTMGFARKLMSLGPWGHSFEKPMFDDVFSVVEKRRIGEAHLRLTLSDGEREYQAVWFFCPEEWFEARPRNMRVIYTLSINEFNGRRSLQLMVNYAQDPDMVLKNNDISV